jgi:hypothetical protein
MTDKVSYKLPSYNPFAAATQSNSSAQDNQKQKEEIDRQEEEHERKEDNFRKLTTAIELINSLKPEYLNPEDINKIKVGGLLKLNYKQKEIDDYYHQYHKHHGQEVLPIEEKIPSIKFNTIKEYTDRIEKIMMKSEELTNDEVQELAMGEIVSFHIPLCVVRDHCERNNIAYNEFDPKQEFTMKVKRNNSLTYHKDSTSYRSIDKEKPDTLKPMEYVDEEHKQAAQIAGKKILELIDNFKIHYKDVTENGYFSADKNTQKEYMLSLEVLIRITKPAIDNRYVVGGFEDYFDPIAEYLRKTQHWSEHPEFVREHRYEILPDGTIEDRYEYTKTHVLGGSIIPIINDVIFIKNNFPFLKAFYKNHFQTKYQALQNREKDEKESVKKDGKSE